MRSSIANRDLKGCVKSITPALGILLVLTGGALYLMHRIFLHKKPPATPPKSDSPPTPVAQSRPSKSDDVKQRPAISTPLPNAASPRALTPPPSPTSGSNGRRRSSIPTLPTIVESPSQTKPETPPAATASEPASPPPLPLQPNSPERVAQAPSSPHCSPPTAATLKDWLKRVYSENPQPTSAEDAQRSQDVDAIRKRRAAARACKTLPAGIGMCINAVSPKPGYPSTPQVLPGFHRHIRENSPSFKWS